MVSLWALAILHPDDAARVQTAVDHLMEGLGSDDATMRLAAAEGLQALQLDPEIVGPKLIHLLDDADPVVAHNLVETFASLGEPAALRAGNALSNEKLRRLAVQVLERLGPKAKLAVPQIVDALAAADGEFRQQLLSVVGNIGPDAAPASGELVRSLDDASEETRISALLALGNIGPGAAAAKSKVVAMIDGSEDPFERVLAAWVIAKTASSDGQAVAKILPVLIKGLSFPDGRVQAEAAITLGELGTAARSAADALDELAARENAPIELREIAKEAAAAVR
jgi:HEAT repeat protein